MDWYYVDQQKRFGPVNEEEFQVLVDKGVIHAKTLVWNPRLKGWEEYAKVQISAGRPTVGGSSLSAMGDSSFCSECGRPFPNQEMLAYGNLMICAQCKPVFVQKLKEGLYRPAGMSYAGFWIRFGAKIIDGILLWVVNTIISLPFSFLGVPMMMSRNPSITSIVPFFLIQGILLLIQVAVAGGYNTWMVGKYGATLGKMACSLKVVTAEGERVTYMRALARYFSEWLSSLTCTIGYIMAAFDVQKRTLHDRICNTRVIKK